ncbi:MAG TPA: flagellar motor switch protein FliN [Stellaceae bacterium]|nr:flagellar motor switch protein FliN [Stellaceae bacterium]
MADDPPIGDPPIGAAVAPDDGASPFAALEPSPEGARPAALDGASDGGPAGRLDLVFDVPVCLSVELGRTEVPIRDVVNIGRGSIIELDRGPGTPLDVRVNGVLIGRGEVVLVNAEKLGLRFVEVVSQAERVKRLG